MTIEGGARAGLIAPDEKPTHTSRAGHAHPRARPGTWRSSTGSAPFRLRITIKIVRLDAAFAAGDRFLGLRRLKDVDFDHGAVPNPV